MKITSIALLVSAALGSIGLAGCQTTEDDYYYDSSPRVVNRGWVDDSVYVSRPSWRERYDRPAPVYHRDNGWRPPMQRDDNRWRQPPQRDTWRQPPPPRDTWRQPPPPRGPDAVAPMRPPVERRPDVVRQPMLDPSGNPVQPWERMPRSGSTGR